MTNYSLFYENISAAAGNPMRATVLNRFALMFLGEHGGDLFPEGTDIVPFAEAEDIIWVSSSVSYNYETAEKIKAVTGVDASKRLIDSVIAGVAKDYRDLQAKLAAEGKSLRPVVLLASDGTENEANNLLLRFKYGYLEG